MSTEAKAFLGALFGDKPEHLHLLVWTLQDKRSAWFQSTAKAAAYAAAQAAQKDVYVGVALAPKDYGPSARCPSAQVAGMIGVWVDVDVRSPHHKKQNLPPDERAALELVDSLGLAPSMVVDSGHGLQAWWLFREPWIFESEAERQAGATLAQRWIYAFKAKAAAKGWDVDSTFDLARVLRIPGTINRKGEPVPVRIIQPGEWCRYDPSEFEAYLPDELPGAAQRNRWQPSLVGGTITLNPNATPPFDKWEALLEIEAKVRLTWERKRKDIQDQSASSYDFSLANYAVMAGWSDQEVSDLLIANRRKHGDDLKLRVDYYERTIGKVRATLRKVEAEERLEDALHAADKDEAGPSQPAQAPAASLPGGTDPEEEERPPAPPQTPPRRHTEVILESLSDMWNVEVRRVVKYLSDPPTYRLETSKGAMTLGGVEAIADSRVFRNKVAAATNVLIPRYKNDKWDGIAQALLNACEEESIGAEATDEGQAHAWVGAYLDTYRPADAWEEALAAQLPFRRDGPVYIVGPGFRKWLALNQGEKVGAKAMGAILRAGGCSAEVMAFDGENGKTTRSVWRLPPAYR